MAILKETSDNVVMVPYRNVRVYQMLGDCDAIIVAGQVVGIRKVLGGRQQHKVTVKARLRRAARKADRREEF